MVKQFLTNFTAHKQPLSEFNSAECKQTQLTFVTPTLSNPNTTQVEKEKQQYWNFENN